MKGMIIFLIVSIVAIWALTFYSYSTTHEIGMFVVAGFVTIYFGLMAWGLWRAIE